MAQSLLATDGYKFSMAEAGWPSAPRPSTTRTARAVSALADPKYTLEFSRETQALQTKLRRTR
jgi:hypothetical protein